MGLSCCPGSLRRAKKPPSPLPGPDAMRHSSSNHSYSPSAYDDYMCLKPSPFMWLALFWLSRAITLPILIGVGHIAGVNADAMTMLRDYWNADQLIPAAFALPVLFACCRRVHTAPRAVRTIWARGRTLLLVSAVLDIALSALAPWHHETSDQSLLALSTAAVDLYFLAYVFAARRVRDTFLDFP